LMKFKLREIELEKDINDIKAQLEFLNQQAKAKEHNVSEWQAELDEEYRHLEALASTTEEKLKEEMRHFHASYEEERQLLIKEKSDLEESKKEDDKKFASEKKKLCDENHLEGGGNSCAKIERDEMDKDEESKTQQTLAEDDGFVDEGGVVEGDYFMEDVSVKRNGEVACRDNMLKTENEIINIVRTGKDCISESNTLSVSEKNVCSDVKDSVAESIDIQNELTYKTTNKVRCVEDESFELNAIVETSLIGERSVERDDRSIMSNTTDIREENNSVKCGDYIVPDHLAPLNQPRELQDEVSLRSFDLFDLPEVNESSSGTILAPALQDNLEEDTETRTNEEESQSKPAYFAPPDQPQQVQGELPLSFPSAPDLSKVDESSNKKLLTVDLKGNQKQVVESLPAKATTETRRITDVARGPRKTLSQMRLKVEEALEKAISIRNGDSSSFHSRSVSNDSQMNRPVENESLGDTKVSHREDSSFSSSKGISLSRQPLHPICPMIRETDRLAGFIRRYEKKLQTVCKSLLTLASVNEEEKEILAARELELPEMLDFVVKQDWYKAYSTDSKSTGVPHLIFSKMKSGNQDDLNREKGYTITPTGNLFLQIDGPVPSDVCRFLTYLNSVEEGLTRDAMLQQWKEIARLSGDEQSQRVCDKLDKLISFCLDSHMIKK